MHSSGKNSNVVINVLNAVPFITSSVMIGAFGGFGEASGHHMTHRSIVKLGPILRSVNPSLSRIDFGVQLSAALNVIPLTTLSLLEAVRSVRRMGPIMVNVRCFNGFVVASVRRS